MGGSETSVKFNKQERGGVKMNSGGGQNFKKSVNIGNERKKLHKCLILMLNLKVSKQTRNDGNKNKVIIKSVKHINKLSTSK